MTDLLQRLIRWPLWSWRNLTITTVIVLASLAGLGRVSTALQTSPGAPLPAAAPATTDTPTPTTAPPSPSVLTPAAVGPSGTDRSPETIGRPVRDCRDAADSFVHAWARPTLPQAEWLAGLTAYAAGSLRAQLATTDPARVPATRVLTDPKPASGDGKGEVFRVVTDAGAVTVQTVKTKRVCVVRDIQPDDTVPGAPTPPLAPTPGKRG